MKIFLAYCLALAGIPMLAFLFLLGLIFFAPGLSAEEFSPLDFSYDYSKFEVTVGYDDVNGRYATYHYEFID